MFDLLCMRNMAHASKLKKHDNDDDLLGDKGLMKELKVRLMERMLGAELTPHLVYEPHGEPDSQQTNRRNGASRKVLNGFVARIRRWSCFPLPQTDLACGYSDGYAKSCVTVQDGDTSLDLRDLPFEVLGMRLWPRNLTQCTFVSTRLPR